MVFTLFHILYLNINVMFNLCRRDLGKYWFQFYNKIGIALIRVLCHWLKILVLWFEPERFFCSFNFSQKSAGGKKCNNLVTSFSAKRSFSQFEVIWLPDLIQNKVKCVQCTVYITLHCTLYIVTFKKMTVWHWLFAGGDRRKNITDWEGGTFMMYISCSTAE